MMSNSEEESRVVDLMDTYIFQQEIKVLSCSLVITFCQKNALSAEVD